MRECNKYEITVEQFINFTRTYTTPIAIHIVSNDIKIPGLKQFDNKYISGSDEDFLLKYFKDVPVWNAHIELHRDYSNIGAYVIGIVVICDLIDIKDILIANKKLMKERLCDCAF